jgi:hypothetical protein
MMHLMQIGLYIANDRQANCIYRRIISAFKFPVFFKDNFKYRRYKMKNEVISI